MKIGKYPVRHTYKPARIICDALSLVMAYITVSSTLHFFPLYKETISAVLNEDLKMGDLKRLYKYGESLAYRQYAAWIFPALVLVIIAVYLILTLKSHKFERYPITKRNAQAVYDWYAFAVSLCKIPAQLFIIEVMYITHQRLMFNNVSVFSVQMIIYVFVVLIIIRLSVHRISAITKPAAKKQESGGVKAKIVENDEENNEDKD